LITQEQFVQKYSAALEPHDTRVKAIVEAKRIVQGYMLLLGGHFECNAQNINVMSMPGDARKRYFTDDELIEMTSEEDYMDANCQRKCPRCGHSGLHICDNTHIWDDDDNME